MKLHWSPKSPYVRKVMVAAHELDLLPRLELVRSVAAMTVPNERLMADNPLSKIPALVLGDGRVLFDSVVICEYLNELAAGPLFPPAGDAKWQSLRWHAFGNGLLDLLILWRNERERADVPPSQLMMQAFDCKLRASLAKLETEASALALSPFAIGHLTLACMLGYADFRFEHIGWRALAPALGEWYENMRARPSFVATEPTREG